MVAPIFCLRTLALQRTKAGPREPESPGPQIFQKTFKKLLTFGSLCAIIKTLKERYATMKKIVNYKDRQFICYVGHPFSHLIEVTVWERKRPRWLIFKDSYCCSHRFCYDENDDFNKFVGGAVLGYLVEQEKENALYENGKTFKKLLTNR